MNDEKNGHGRLFFSNNEIFEGYFRNDQIEGPGSFYSVDGGIIKGKWRGDRKIE